MFADLFMKGKPMSFAKQNYLNEFIPTVREFNEGVSLLAKYATEDSDVVLGEEKIQFVNFKAVANEADVVMLQDNGFTVGENGWEY